MAALGWLQNLAIGGASAAVSAVVSGSVSDGALEIEIKQGWQELFIILDGSTWVTGQDFNDARQSVIDGLDSAGSEATGWNAEVRDKLLPNAVTRISDSVLRILLPVASAYEIAANETITDTVPASAHSDASELTASPTFNITASAQTGITNAGATQTLSQYEMCERTNFRQLPQTLIRDGYNYRTREKSADPRHPQELIRSVTDKQPGSVSPELDDVFLANDEVKAVDL